MKKPILEKSPEDSLPYGTKIAGLLDDDVKWLYQKSKGDNELWKNTINLWLWKDNDNHMADLVDVLDDNKKRREASLTKAGSNKTGTMGGGISLPSGLFIALDKVDKQLFNDKKRLNKFKKAFPQFKTY